jgi:hypothetical protein
MTASLVAARVFSAVLAVATGAALGLVLTFTHRQYVAEVGGIPVPWGLLGGLAIVAAFLVGMRLAFGERVAPLAAAAGLLGAIAVLGIPNANGSTVYVGDAIDYTWILAPTLIAIVVVGWPSERRR